MSNQLFSFSKKKQNVLMSFLLLVKYLTNQKHKKPRLINTYLIRLKKVTELNIWWLYADICFIFLVLLLLLERKIIKFALSFSLLFTYMIIRKRQNHRGDVIWSIKKLTCSKIRNYQTLVFIIKNEYDS